MVREGRPLIAGVPAGVPAGGPVDQSGPDFIPWLNGELSQRGWKVAELARRIVAASDVDPESADYIRRVNGKAAALSRMLNEEVGLGDDLAREIATALGVSQVEVFRHAGLITEPVHADQEAAYEYLRLLGEIQDDQKRQEAIDLVHTILRRVAEQRVAEQRSSDSTDRTDSSARDRRKPHARGNS